MPKRKLISLPRERNDHTETNSDISSNEEIVTKRIKPNSYFDNADDQEHSNSDSNPRYFALFNDKDNEQNDSGSGTPGVHLHLSNVLNSDTEEVNNAEYDGYQSFINSFQFFSDEEDSENNSQISVPQVSRTEAISERIYSKKGKKKLNYKSQSQKTMKIEWQDHYSYASFTKDNIRYQQINPSIRALVYYLNNFECIFVDHPTSLPLVGYLKVTLVAGKASIHGYELVLNQPITVFSQKQTGILSITSHFCKEEVMCSMQKNVLLNLTQILPFILSDHVKDYVKQNMKYCSAVFILQSCILPPALQFLQLYSPSAVSFETKSKNIDNVASKTKYTALLEKEENILKFGPEYEEIFSTIHKHLLRINRQKPANSRTTDTELIDSVLFESDLKKGPEFISASGYRILISGPKKAGKSTMLRYLVNSFLNEYSAVYYLDTDPGQSEFTPSGGVSLVKVTEPIFGPSYTHLKKPLKMVFTGTITPETSPPMHMRSISKLISYFNSHFPDSILVVNTIGWLTGVGNLILEHIREKLMPAAEIQLTSEAKALNIKVERGLLRCTVGFERDAASSTKQGDNRPSDLRDWALLAYMGQCQSYYLQPHSLNAFRPVSICWDDIAVYNFNKRLMYNRYYEALNGSVVALCRVKKSCMLTPVSPDYPLTLEEEPDNECIGYGFVRSVDEENHLLHVATPLSCNILNDRVNALLSGNILVPRDVIYEQKILNTELDYTDVSKVGKTELRKAISKRSRGHSSNDRN